ncbi:hypothetical protein, partial [Escherichia coli]|uniref:hypothetical protein n=1 Tax=Escherichia coli TaxID=562 RepID=UPI0020C08F61
DRNRSHWSTSKTPSYTKSVSWQHHLTLDGLRKLQEELKGKISDAKASGKNLNDYFKSEC